MLSPSEREVIEKAIEEIENIDVGTVIKDISAKNRAIARLESLLTLTKE